MSSLQMLLMASLTRVTDGRCCVVTAVALKGELQDVRYLIEFGADIHYTVPGRPDALQIALESGKKLLHSYILTHIFDKVLY